MAGDIVHYEIGAQDSDRAQAFWSGLFGWQFSEPMPEMDYRMAQMSDSQGAAIFHADTSQVKIYHLVDDIDASTAKVRELGGEADDKAPVPGHGWFAACKDTEGNAFHLWQGDPSAGS